MEKVEVIAKMIDHSLLHPTLTDGELAQGSKIAKRFKVASVCIKPYAIKLAAELLKGSGIAVGTVIGFPHGSNKIDVKVFEAEQACKDGAIELDMVINIGKVLSKDWAYIKKEIQEVLNVTHRYKAILKVIFENDFLSEKHKIQLCKICSELKVDFVKTSTGYGFIKGDDGKYSYQGATDHDLSLMRENTSSEIQVKAAGRVRTLDDVLRVKGLGVTRIGATATESIITEARNRMINLQE
ncbi:MAG: deoxyribose-phosphate aldolase [Candidatus Hodarchaeales archaeon]|jgi:deoxyribose-phosphate aldolase